jgi:hypothetical protein
MSVTISKFLERLTASRLFDDTDLDALRKEVAGEDGNGVGSRKWNDAPTPAAEAAD